MIHLLCRLSYIAFLTRKDLTNKTDYRNEKHEGKGKLRFSNSLILLKVSYKNQILSVPRSFFHCNRNYPPLCAQIVLLSPNS